MTILEPLKNQSESWKSPGNLFLKKGMNLVVSAPDSGPGWNPQQGYFVVFLGKTLNARSAPFHAVVEMK